VKETAEQVVWCLGGLTHWSGEPCIRWESRSQQERALLSGGMCCGAAFCHITGYTYYYYGNNIITVKMGKSGKVKGCMVCTVKWGFWSLEAGKR